MIAPLIDEIAVEYGDKVKAVSFGLHPCLLSLKIESIQHLPDAEST